MTTFANNTFTNGLLFANKYPVRVRVRARDPGGVRVRVRVRARGLGGVRVRVRVRVRPISGGETADLVGGLLDVS